MRKNIKIRVLKEIKGVLNGSSPFYICKSLTNPTLFFSSMRRRRLSPSAASFLALSAASFLSPRASLFLSPLGLSLSAFAVLASPSLHLSLRSRWPFHSRWWRSWCLILFPPATKKEGNDGGGEATKRKRNSYFPFYAFSLCL